MRPHELVERVRELAELELQLEERDVRVTTRFVPTEPFTGLMGALHETGQALYDLGLPEARVLDLTPYKARAPELGQNRDAFAEAVE